MSSATTQSTKKRASMDAMISARVKGILEAHANNLIENMDMGEEVLKAMLQRAHEPINNEEFTRREKALIMAEYQLKRIA